MKTNSNSPITQDIEPHSVVTILLNTRGRRIDRHCASRRLRRLAQASVVRSPRMHPHMLRHTFVTTMLDVGVDRRDVQIAAHHADPRTTVRYDRPRTNLDRHPNYILAAYMAPGTDISTRTTLPMTVWRHPACSCGRDLPRLDHPAERVAMACSG
ncbi:tyrosine-type recombinase/integrase [Nocardia vinacea]|uniref:tyrosine-type recombinase/integrase n=1 Tax=Nocardia vinacea TaxID=96468 RepID=UPI003AF269BB